MDLSQSTSNDFWFGDVAQKHNLNNSMLKKINDS